MVSPTAMHDVDDENLPAADDGGGLLSCLIVLVRGQRKARPAAGWRGWVGTLALSVTYVGQGEHVGMLSALLTKIAQPSRWKAWECCGR